jgi:hypothetical protein
MTYMADTHKQAPAALDYTSDWYRVPDPALQDIASLVIHEGQDIWITLVVSGGLIGGLVESGREYFTGISQKLHDAQELFDLLDPSASAVPEPVRQLRQRDRETFESYDSTAPSSRVLRYLHLRDARYVTPGQLPISLGHTRILLSQISAWSIGNPEVSPTLR